MRRLYLICTVAALLFPAPQAHAKAGGEVNTKWQAAMQAAVDSFPHAGGYYTGRKSTPDFPKSAWRGFNEAYHMILADRRPVFDAKKAQPSFCSLATYGALIKALLIYDTAGAISREAWIALKPYCGIVDVVNERGYNQDDGEGCWGRCNANGPAIAVFVNELKAGYSSTGYRGAMTAKYKESPAERYLTDDEWRADPVWAQALPGDLMKIFWNRNDRGSDSGAVIGCNDVPTDEQEHGHSVVFMGYTPDGKVQYWSSNGPGKNPVENGYGLGTCDKIAIQRVVFTRITKPENFNNAKSIAFNAVNKWLKELNGTKHGTTAELKKYCGIK